MKDNLPGKSILLFAVILVLGGMSFAQTPTPKPRRNSPFAPNPKGRTEIAKFSESEQQINSKAQKSDETLSVVEKSEETANTDNEKDQVIVVEADAQIPTSDKTEQIADNNENAPVAKKTLEEIKKETAAAAPSEIYKVGTGDILFISLQNAPAKESTYFTVLKDGTIDYPLAGEPVSVEGLTAEEIAVLLQEKIKLYENPEVSVKVREHNSHKYTVLGMVEKPGEKFFQREAYPLLVVRAEAVIQPKADRAIIKRNNSQTETVDLKDVKSDDILIFPGDVVEFTSSETAESDSGKQFFYIGGEIVDGGQKKYFEGMTLTQAILASGGLKKQSVKRVVVRRKNEAGMLFPRSYDLKSIKDGKSADPEIEAGDTIEVGN